MPQSRAQKAEYMRQYGIDNRAKHNATRRIRYAVKSAGRPHRPNLGRFKVGHVGYLNSGNFKPGARPSPSTEFKPGHLTHTKGVPVPDEMKARISKKLTGGKASFKTRLLLSALQRQRVAAGLHNNYKGGITPENHLERTRIEYTLWREGVFERDGYTCRLCCKKGGYLEADHVVPFAVSKALRTDLDNGRTLCRPCHSFFGMGPQELVAIGGV